MVGVQGRVEFGVGVGVEVRGRVLVQGCRGLRFGGEVGIKSLLGFEFRIEVQSWSNGWDSRLGFGVGSRLKSRDGSRVRYRGRDLGFRVGLNFGVGEGLRLW